MSGRTKRPYAAKNIDALEQIFADASGDRGVLAALQHELGFRNTARASRLARRIAAAAKSNARSDPGPRRAAAGYTTTEPPAKPAPPSPERGKTPAAPRRGTISASVPCAAPVPSDPAEADIAFVPPATANEPSAILAAWTALEALSPQTYRRPEDRAAGDRRCVADLGRGPLPWTTGERSRPKRQLYYEIYLGAVHMDLATDRLSKVFGLDEEAPSRAREKAALGTLLVDRNGFLLEEKSVAVSSFGWALPIALRKGLGQLGRWPQVQQALMDGLTKVVRRFDEDGNPMPIDRNAIEVAHSWLVGELGLERELVEPPSFAIRVYHYFQARNPPEVSLLNSFFLGDLARTQSRLGQQQLPRTLRQYLGIDPPAETLDLLRDRRAVESAVAPALTPVARWPAPGNHPLVLLQQAAVNLARHETAHSGLAAVNGPPGTGKTTLLRDVVAAAVVDRAAAMARFADPLAAFQTTGLKVQAGPKAFQHLYRLDASLRGHEVVVASSNNKAVENVSRELPSVEAVGRPRDEMAYFRSIGDLLHGPKAREDRDLFGVTDADSVETWGLIAAVLGNAGNRFAFTQDFWWHEDRGFRTYLKAAKGDDVVREIRDEETGKIIERLTPAVVTAERPPSPAAAAGNWRAARKRFTELHAEVERDLATLEAVRSRCLELVQVRAAAAEAERAMPPLMQTAARAREVEQEHTEPARAARDMFHAAERAHNSHMTQRPGFLARLFRTQGFRRWRDICASLAVDLASAAGKCGSADQRLTEAQQARRAADARLSEAQGQLDTLNTRRTDLAQAIDAQRSVLGDRIVDELFFARGHETFNLTAPWIPDALHRRREELFIAGLELHRAFIDVTAQKILHNLGALIGFVSGGPPQDSERRAMLGDLWSTLFLVVPVVSTTFASVEAMFGELAPGDIGWLLIDEAGQALPQAAVGALLRARRAVVVGDPLQIPPVVSLPERLGDEICRFFRTDSSSWAAPIASAQTVADRASRHRACFEGHAGEREVGIPLLVHRRCQEPMFGISNRVAYAGQMVHAVGPRRPGPIGEVLGASQWFDVDGEADTKWCPDEGELVVNLLHRLAAAGITAPDVFIITPFRIVAQELRRRLEDEPELFSAFGVQVAEWVRDRVGTIHTVQGREADTVILVLGAPESAQARARSWAANSPNIINVAVSRAQQNLYVVGSRGAWSGIGHAVELGSLGSRGAAEHQTVSRDIG